MPQTLQEQFEQLLRDFDVIDLRSSLARVNRHIDYRPLSVVNSATLHYNGTPTGVRTASQEIAYYRMVARDHVARNWGTAAAPVYGHGIMYPFGFGDGGRLYWLRDLNLVTWHCANQGGNRTSLAGQFPIGGNERPTVDQWDLAVRFLDAAGQLLRFDRAAVRGHQEWPKYTYRNGRLVVVPNSTCPGPHISRLLTAYRTPGAQWWRVTAPAGLVVRTAPTTQANIALDGKALFPQGHTFVGTISTTEGEAVLGNRTWIHRTRDGLGFMPQAWLEPTTAPNA